MSWIEALVLGMIQGLTEFLPVSSSAHLKLTSLILGSFEGENRVVFDLICHLGTLCAAVYFLRVDIYYIFKFDKRKLFLILLATLPLIPIYFLLRPVRSLASQAPFLGPALMITAAILFAGHKWRLRPNHQPPLTQQMRDVLLIGTMQSMALIPGISRSASTISCAHALGWNAKEAVRFSFLLSIPTIFGGNCLELLHLLHRSPTATPLSISFSSCLIGFLSSCGLGMVMIRTAIRLLEKGNLKPFAWYCLFLGIAATIYLNFIYG